MGIFNKNKGDAKDVDGIIPVPPPISVTSATPEDLELVAKKANWEERGRTALNGKKKSDAFNIMMIALQGENFIEWPDVMEIISVIDETYVASACNEEATIKHLREYTHPDGRKIIVPEQIVEEYRNYMSEEKKEVIKETKETKDTTKPAVGAVKVETVEKKKFFTGRKLKILKTLGLVSAGAALGVGGTVAVVKYRAYRAAEAKKAASAAAKKALVAKKPGTQIAASVRDNRHVAKKPVKKPVVAKAVVKPAAAN